MRAAGAVGYVVFLFQHVKELRRACRLYRGFLPLVSYTKIQHFKEIAKFCIKILHFILLIINNL